MKQEFETNKVPQGLESLSKLSLRKLLEEEEEEDHKVSMRKVSYRFEQEIELGEENANRSGECRPEEQRW